MNMNLTNELQQAFNLVSNPNNQLIQNGEAMLKKLKMNADYPLHLLKYMKENHNNVGQLRAAIELRIWCEDYKDLEEYERQYFSNSIESIKQNILLAYLGYSGKISKTLLPGIVSLASIEFPDNWDGLLRGLMRYSMEQDTNATLKVIQLFKQLTDRYSYSSRSDPLYRQINKVCDQLHDFIMNLTEQLVNNIVNIQHIPENILILQVLMKLFYNLNYQDLHPKFEERIFNWMNVLNVIMKLPNNNEGFFKCKGAALESILLFASKYKEDVEESIKNFCSDIWTLCENASSDPEYDDVVFNSLKYFRSLIMWPDMKPFFSDNIENMMKSLILPNISINKNTMDLFYEEIQTFIGYYFRNGQIGTRRAAALELLRAICRNYDSFSPFIQEQVQGFSANSQMIENECLLLNLIMESAAKAFRDIDGVTQTSINENIIIYCYQNIVKSRLNQIHEFITNNPNGFIQSNFNIIHIVIILRYLFYFRIYFPHEDLQLILQLCCGMKSQNSSLRQIIFLVINSFITIRHGNFQMYKDIKFYFDADKLQPITIDILKIIYENQQLEQTKKLNENVTKILYNLTKCLGKGCIQYYDHFSYIFDSMLKKTVQYEFASISGLFQALGTLSFYVCIERSPHIANLQEKIFNYFQNAIKSQSDIANFCFQILSIFAKYSDPGNAKYENLYRSLLQINNWSEQNLSIMSSYVHYISIYFELHPKALLDDKSAIFSILDQLIALDRFELFYRLLRDIVVITNLDGFASSGYLQICIRHSCDIVRNSPLATKTVLAFIFLLTWDHPIQKVNGYINQIIPQFYEQCLLQNQNLVQTMQSRKERKLMYGSICNGLVTNIFSNVENEGIILNLLIDNSTGKFRFQKLSQVIKENEVKQKKEASFKKLDILKENQRNDDNINIDEEVTLVKAYMICYERNSNIANFISSNNAARINRLYEKHKNQ